MTTAQRHASWYSCSEADIRTLLDQMPFEREDVRRDFAYYVARLRYIADVAALKAEEILAESTDQRTRTHAFLVRLLVDNLQPGEDCEVIKLTWPRKQGGAP